MFESTQNTQQIEYPDLISKNVSYKIIDLSGKTLLEGILSGDRIDVSKLNNSIYILKVDINGERINKEVMIEKH